METAPEILDGLEVTPQFPLAIDLERKKTPRYERTSAVFVDKDGTVRQVFPMMTHMRASAAVLLDEIDALLK